MDEIKWHKYPEEKPSGRLQCWVTNEKYFGLSLQAWYSNGHDLFMYHNDVTGENVPVSVTHFVELPDGYERGGE